MAADTKLLPSPQSFEQNLMSFTQPYVLNWSRQEPYTHTNTPHAGSLQLHFKKWLSLVRIYYFCSAIYPWILLGIYSV